MIRIDNAMDVKVTGVYDDIPNNSRFSALQFVSTWDFFVAQNYWMKEEENNWVNSLTTFVELQPNTTFESASAKISDIKFNKLSREEALRENPALFVQPMSRWHLHSEWENGQEVRGRIQFVWFVCDHWSVCVVVGLYQLHEPEHRAIGETCERSWNS
ncbi:MAG: hypothetical protein WDO15_24750 [Bacteroidota bacterium]